LARHRGAVCRLCRREGMKLFLKGTKCFTEKCPIERRNFVPGQHGKARRAKLQGYGLQLREKQKVRRIYGVLERQFRNYFEKAADMKGVTGENLLQLLERRLDNVLYRMGLGSSRSQARQVVLHGHIQVNGRKVNIPSFALKVNDIVEVRNSNVSRQLATKNLEISTSRAVPDWLSLTKDAFKGVVMRIPTRDEIQPIANEQAVVEFYSR
jgi:small subunit ribosomal protein S4